MSRIRVLPWTLALAGIVTLGACEDESTGPDIAVVAGTYTATTFDVTDSGMTFDILDLGGDLTMTLNANGTMSGNLFAPGMDDGGADLDEDFAGSWDIEEDGRITFELEDDADTFLEDVAFDFDEEDGTLATTDFAGGAQFNLVLTRQ